jgi:OmpA-OmpF porin, OOP family
MRLTLLLIILTGVVSAQEFSPRYELVKMDKTVNTFHHEAAPVISPDGKTLYFFVQNHPDNTMGKVDTQDIWVSRKDENGAWSQAEHLRSPFNIHQSNQVFTVFDDGSLFIRGGRSKGEKGFSLVTNGSLREITVRDFKTMNKGRFYGASMSADMKHIILYFSEKPNSPISSLYISHLASDGTYTRPELMKLSSTTDDLGPFIAPDQKTLYFASARQAPGRQGGTDIYKTTRTDDTWTNWTTPVNLGKPVNTSALDYYFTIDREGNVFTSRANKAMEGGQLDLFMLVPKTFNMNVTGIVLNEKTHAPIEGANVNIAVNEREPVNMKSNASGNFEAKMSEALQYTLKTTAGGYQAKEQKFTMPELLHDTTVYVEVLLKPIPRKLILTGTIYDRKTEKQIPAKLEASLKGERNSRIPLDGSRGNYEKEVPKLGWYMITASAEGYLNATDSIYAESDDLTPFVRDIYLTPIEVGVTVRLKNIYFDFDKTTLKRESYIELNKVVEFLKQNGSVEIEIAGHTDNKGSDEYNENLSQGRSQSVVDYLISQGIKSSRLSAHGYGESKPIDTNDTDEGRANNRRVEFTILKK